MSGTGPTRVERHYHYDAVGRLVRVELGDGTTISYEYDGTGNRLVQRVERSPSAGAGPSRERSREGS